MKNLLFFTGDKAPIGIIGNDSTLYITTNWNSVIERMKRNMPVIAFYSPLSSASCIAEAKSLGYTVHTITCQTEK